MDLCGSAGAALDNMVRTDRDVNKFAPAMKKADPQIRIGLAWGGPYIEDQTDPGRDSFVLRETQQWVDFIDFHLYTGRWEEK